MILLVLYRIAAEGVLWIARAGKPVWPARWRIADRLDVTQDDAASVQAETVWMHAASLGECKGLRALAESFPDAVFKDRNLLLTCNTPAGLTELEAFAATRPGRARARLAPLDHPRLARRFIARNGIRTLVLFELELWPHWIDAAEAEGVPVLWVSARFARLGARARKRYAGGPLRRAALRRVLERIAWTQAQTQDDVAALSALGCAPCEAGADLKGLRHVDDPVGADTGAEVEDGARGTAFVSFHADELPALVAAVRAIVARAPHASELPLWVFPRKANDPRALDAFHRALAPYGFATGAPEDGTRVLVDRFGHVDSALHRARAAVVGGSFADHGGHNLWEPLRAGTRMFIGPFHAAQETLARPLAARGLLTIVRDADDLAARMEDFIVKDVDAETGFSAEHARDLTAHRAACDAFIAEERAQLLAAAHRVQMRLEYALREGALRQHETAISR